VTEVAGVNNPVTLFSVLYAERGSAERAVMAGIVVEATNAAAELLGDEVAEELVDVITAAVSTAVERETGMTQQPERPTPPQPERPQPPQPECPSPPQPERRGADQGGYRCTCHVHR
jgi:hypothetical protein